MKKVKRELFEELLQKDIANQVLYEMCEKYPELLAVNQLSAKAFLIGRSYAASPQRGVKNNSRSMNYSFFEFYSSEVIKNIKLNKKVRDFDSLLIKLKSIDFLSLADLYETIKLIIIFNDASYASIHNLGGKNAISFSSKLLHFHLPRSTFIIDSYANKNAKLAIDKTSKEFVKNESIEFIKRLENESLYQPKYNDLINHYLRCYQIQHNAGEEGYLLLPRDVDNYLIREMFI